MLSLLRCRALLRRNDLTDAELEALRDQLYVLAAALLSDSEGAEQAPGATDTGGDGSRPEAERTLG